MCLSIGTPKIINFPFVANGKLIIFRCSKSRHMIAQFTMHLNTGTPKNINFPVGTNKKIKIIGVPKFRHFRVPLVFLLVAVVALLWLPSHSYSGQCFCTLHQCVICISFHP